MPRRSLAEKSQRRRRSESFFHRSVCRLPVSCPPNRLTPPPGRSAPAAVAPRRRRQQSAESVFIPRRSTWSMVASSAVTTFGKWTDNRAAPAIWCGHRPPAPPRGTPRRARHRYCPLPATTTLRPRAPPPPHRQHKRLRVQGIPPQELPDIDCRIRLGEEGHYAPFGQPYEAPCPDAARRHDPVGQRPQRHIRRTAVRSKAILPP